jgi:hypothetical protein
MVCTSTTLALEMPDDFDCATFDAVNALMGKYAQAHPQQWHPFASAWNGVAYRYRASVENDAEFRRLIVDTAPPAPERYVQETALYACMAFVLSTVESFFFASYSCASLVNTRAKCTAFPMTRNRVLKFSPWDVVERFQDAYPDDVITDAMRRCLGNKEHHRVRTLRNVLTHRGTIPRRVFLSLNARDDRPSAIPSNPGAVATDWQYDAPLGAHTTGDAIAWLSAELARLIPAAQTFCAARL